MNILRRYLIFGTLPLLISVFIIGGITLIPSDIRGQWQIDNDYPINTSPARRKVEFYREKIIMRIQKDYLEVNGIYYFRNNTAGINSLPIVYPFPVDESHFPPDSILVTSKTTDSKKPIKHKAYKNGDKISCILPLEAGDCNIMEVYYRQKLKEKRARYILTTTSRWGKPFDFAEYEIFISTDFDSVNVNYPCDLDHQDEKWQKFYFSAKNFMPDKDLLVRWK